MKHSLDNFNEIQTKDDMKSFLSTVGSFHDGVLKEMHLLNSAFVGDNLSMYYSFNFDMRLLIQRQWANPSAVECILNNVKEMKLETPDCIWSSSGDVTISKVNEEKDIKLAFDNNYLICSKLYWRSASEWMGKESKFGEYFSVDSMHSFKDIGDGWVMCDNCCESWQPNEKSIVQCPKCSGLNYDCVSTKPIDLD